MVAGQPAAIRLMSAIDTRRFNEGCPTPNQVAMVLHALADHTAQMEMLKHRPDPTSPWPEATSIGRWLHDVADDLEGIELSNSVTPAEPPIKLDSQTWLELLHIDSPQVVIFDPDGWDRKNFEHSWYKERITAEEFRRRVMMSTVQMPKNDYPIDRLVKKYGSDQYEARPGYER